MYPPIYVTCSADSELQSLLGSDPFRLFKFGEAPESVTKPYAVWQQTGGEPENYLSTTPDMDSYTTQVDVYGSSGSSVEAVAEALRDAIEPVAHITNWIGHSRDPDTHNYRFTFLVDWWQSR